MSAAKGVPLTRELLEALLGLSGALLRHGDDGVALDASKLGRACLAALASDAGTPEGERCPYCSFAPESLSDYCDKHRPTFFAAAPDAELDRLLTDFGALMWDRGRGRAIVPNDIPQRKAIHAHVARVKREAFTAGHKAGARVMAAVHEAPAPTGEVIGTAELYDSYVGHLQETHPYPRDAMIPVDLVRREKEEG